VKKKVIDISMRPKCIHPDCNNSGQHTGNYRKDGTPIFRKQCAKHHGMKYGINGWEYKKHRKDYCENNDGRLGYKCNYKIRIEGQLQVDHKNGNPTDNRKRNLQTLCANCHVFKTLMNKDYNSPGRKYFKYNAA
jgi:hypothetical protein